MITPISDGSTSTATDYAARAAQVRSAYEAELNRARDPAVVPQVQRIRVARAWARASRDLEQIDATESRQSAYTIAAEDPHAWRSGSDRDARERAGRIASATGAVEILNDAAQAGDEGLFAAVGHRVVQNAAAYPDSDWAELADDLMRQHRVDGTSVADRVRERQRERPAETIVRRAHYHLSKPSELDGHGEHEIWTLASQDEDAVMRMATAPQRAAWNRVGQPRVTG